MAKIKAYVTDTINPDNNWAAEGWHFFTDDPFEEGAFHSIYGYWIWDMIPNPHYYFQQPSLEDAMSAAQMLATMPELIADLCLACRGYLPGPTVPRFNIHRNECHLPRGWPPIIATPRVIPCVLYDVWNPP